MGEWKYYKYNEATTMEVDALLEYLNQNYNNIMVNGNGSTFIETRY